MVSDSNTNSKLLKSDLFGRVYRDTRDGEPLIRRDIGAARIWTKWLAKRLAAREARALLVLEAVPNIPKLRSFNGRELTRTWLAGEPMHVAKPVDPAFYRDALRLVRQLHARGVTHNDLAKEPNWLRLEDGSPGLVDFQLASISTNRGAWFKTQAREDLRHLLKHKRYYARESLTQRQRQILDHPAWTSRLWRRVVKPIYLLVTRRLLGWADREGAGDRGQTGVPR